MSIAKRVGFFLGAFLTEAFSAEFFKNNCKCLQIDDASSDARSEDTSEANVEAEVNEASEANVEAKPKGGGKPNQTTNTDLETMGGC